MRSETGNPTTANMTYPEYQRSYRENNPEKVIRWRLHQAENLLKKHGYTVKAPDPEGGAAV